MPATLDLPPQAALEFELTALAAFEGLIRQLHADQYRRIQRARELAAEVAGVGESSAGTGWGDAVDVAGRACAANVAGAAVHAGRGR